MKKMCYIIGAVLAGAVAAQATVIQVSGAANSTTVGSSDVGTFGATTLVGDDTAQPQTLAYTISGLDLDGVSGANDDIVLTFQVTTDGQNIRTTTPALAGWLSSGAVTLNGLKSGIPTSEYVQIDFVSLSANLGGVFDAATTAATSFDGFSSVSLGSWGAGDVAVVNGISQAYVDGIADKTIDLSGGGLDANLKAWFDTAANTGAAADAAGAWRPESWNFQVTTIPEPATLGLVTSFGVGVLFIRRRLML